CRRLLRRAAAVQRRQVRHARHQLPRDQADRRGGGSKLRRAGQLMAHWDTSYARDYERLWSPVIKPMAEPVLQRLPLTGARRVLDIGAGCGALAPSLRAGAPGAEIVGIDYSLPMLRHAHGRGVPVAVMDATSLGLSSSRFDAALSAFVLFAVDDPAAALH